VTWRRFATNLAIDTLRQFQVATWIRNAFMQGGSQPMLISISRRRSPPASP
jgi:hypothetical protein